MSVDDLLSVIRERSIEDANGCWIWQGYVDAHGYPRYRIGGTASAGLHRAIVERIEGRPLGVQAAHHKCAVRACVNPDHLEPVSHAANMAEMLARDAFKARIAELESVLREVCPDHPILDRIPIH